MDALIDNADYVWAGFQQTIYLLVFSSILATIIGTILAGMRVSPIPVLRGFGTVYVNALRNTPLLVVLTLITFGLPELGIQVELDLRFRQFNTFFVYAVLGLSLYTAAFICEALRSGVNSVAAGQAEAARSIGMTFTQSLRMIVLPQAFRTVIPPLASIYIALTKNTSVALAVGVAEATFRMRGLLNRYASDLWFIFFGFALGYMLIVAVIAGAAALAERRWSVAR